MEMFQLLPYRLFVAAVALAVFCQADVDNNVCYSLGSDDVPNLSINTCPSAYAPCSVLVGMTTYLHEETWTDCEYNQYELTWGDFLSINSSWVSLNPQQMSQIATDFKTLVEPMKCVLWADDVAGVTLNLLNEGPSSYFQPSLASRAIPNTAITYYKLVSQLDPDFDTKVLSYVGHPCPAAYGDKYEYWTRRTGVAGPAGTTHRCTWTRSYILEQFNLSSAICILDVPLDSNAILASGFAVATFGGSKYSRQSSEGSSALSYECVSIDDGSVTVFCQIVASPPYPVVYVSEIAESTTSHCSPSTNVTTYVPAGQYAPLTVWAEDTTTLTSLTVVSRQDSYVDPYSHCRTNLPTCTTVMASSSQISTALFTCCKPIYTGQVVTADNVLIVDGHNVYPWTTFTRTTQYQFATITYNGQAANRRREAIESYALRQMNGLVFSSMRDVAITMARVNSATFYTFEELQADLTHMQVTFADYGSAIDTLDERTEFILAYMYYNTIVNTILFSRMTFPTVESGPGIMVYNGELLNCVPLVCSSAGTLGGCPQGLVLFHATSTSSYFTLNRNLTVTAAGAERSVVSGISGVINSSLNALSTQIQASQEVIQQQTDDTRAFIQSLNNRLEDDFSASQDNVNNVSLLLSQQEEDAVTLSNLGQVTHSYALHLGGLISDLKGLVGGLMGISFGFLIPVAICAVIFLVYTKVGGSRSQTVLPAFPVERV